MATFPQTTEVLQNGRKRGHWTHKRGRQWPPPLTSIWLKRLRLWGLGGCFLDGRCMCGNLPCRPVLEAVSAWLKDEVVKALVQLLHVSFGDEQYTATTAHCCFGIRLCPGKRMAGKRHSACVLATRVPSNDRSDAERMDKSEHGPKATSGLTWRARILGHRTSYRCTRMQSLSLFCFGDLPRFKTQT